MDRALETERRRLERRARREWGEDAQLTMVQTHRVRKPWTAEVARNAVVVAACLGEGPADALASLETLLKDLEARPRETRNW